MSDSTVPTPNEPPRATESRAALAATVLESMPVESVPAQETQSSAGLPKIVRFETLARCGGEVWIENEGQIYRLRKTRQGKLILTK